MPYVIKRKQKLFTFVFVYQQVPVTSWFDDMHDTELLTLIPIFERLALVDDVIPALQEIHHRRAIV
jgi:TFIIF-interacting CTD phosphatase-like protein